MNQKHLNLIWRKLNILKNSWEELTKKILVDIFGHLFLESLEENSKILKLVVEKTNEFNKILNLVKGNFKFMFIYSFN